MSLSNENGYGTHRFTLYNASQNAKLPVDDGQNSTRSIGACGCWIELEIYGALGYSSEQVLQSLRHLLIDGCERAKKSVLTLYL
jgi:hypothetical protein